MPNLPSGTVTFLFTDIQGSTRLWQDYPEAMDAAYARHDAVLRDACAAHNGVVYKTIGDAFQVAFPTAAEALAAAGTAQWNLVAEPWELPEPLPVRMALHVCAATPVAEGDYRAPGLNRLGRLLSAAHGDQILLSTAVAELTRGALPAGWELHDLGEHRLRDLQPERVYQLLAPGLPRVFPPLRSLDARPNNLPVQLTPFIGRERELITVGELVRRPEVRLLTLTGPGGTGKTRLGLQAAAEASDGFEDGVFFVPLAALTEPALVLSAIAGTLGVQESGDRPLRDAVVTFLEGKRLLLVLDNFEQVVAAAGLVADLLTACPHLSALVTSRVRLGVYGEQEFPVPPLALPDPRHLPDLAALSQYEAVRLFIERAQAVKPDFAVTNETAPPVAQICVRLDGLPLAIELAAARIRLLPPAAMLARLQSRLPLLTGGARNLPARQQTLRGAIAWSYELLGPDERALYRRLAVFAEGFTVEAAEAVAGSQDSGELTLDVLDGLERLVDHNLLRQTEGIGGEPRFVMLETIREFGLEQLVASVEAEEAHERHATFFLALAEESDAVLSGPEPGLVEAAWLTRLDSERDNLRAALEWSIERADQGETALQLAGALSSYWTLRNYVREGQRWLERALPRGASAPLALRAKTLLAASEMSLIQGNYEHGLALGEQSLVLYRALGDKEGIGRTLARLGVGAADTGDLARAATLLEESLVLARDLGHMVGVIYVLVSLGAVRAEQGDDTGAERLLGESLALARAHHDQRSEAFSLVALGDLSRNRGDARQAARFYRESIEGWLHVGDSWGVALSLHGLALLAGAGGQSESAARLLGAAAELREVTGVPLPPAEHAKQERAVADLCDALGKEAFRVAWAAGRALSLEEAVAEALGEGAAEG